MVTEGRPRGCASSAEVKVRLQIGTEVQTAHVEPGAVTSSSLRLLVGSGLDGSGTVVNGVLFR